MTIISRLGVVCFVTSLLSIAFAQSTLTLSSGTAAAGSAVPLTLTLSTSGVPPAALQWTFGYPTANVSAISVVAGPALNSAGKSLTCNAITNGYTCVASGINSNTIGSGTVATASVT